MIKDLIMSGQRDNYLLLSELLKNLTPNEIWDEFIAIVDLLDDYYKKNNLEKLLIEFDNNLFDVYVTKASTRSNFTLDLEWDQVYYDIELSEFDFVRFFKDKVYFGLNPASMFSTPSEEFKIELIKTLSNISNTI